MQKPIGPKKIFSQRCQIWPKDSTRKYFYTAKIAVYFCLLVLDKQNKDCSLRYMLSIYAPSRKHKTAVKQVSRADPEAARKEDFDTICIA